MKQPIRFFSIGMLFSTVVLMLFFFYLDEDIDAKNIPAETLIQALKEKGYHAVPEDEYIEFSLAKKEKADQEAAENEDTDTNQAADETATENDEEQTAQADDESATNQEENKQEDQKVYTYILKVEPNMMGPTISQLLADHKIIDDPQAFSRFLEDEGYSRYIQLGEHTLTSDMSFKEIAETIAKRK